MPPLSGEVASRSDDGEVRSNYIPCISKKQLRPPHTVPAPGPRPGAGKLSFGQQQRVAFIRAFCQPFDFLFLDEPISHLDDENSRIMGEIIIDEAGKQGAGVIATSIGKHIELPYKKVLQL